jgi:hypothetical protein
VRGFDVVGHSFTAVGLRANDVCSNEEGSALVNLALGHARTGTESPTFRGLACAYLLPAAVRARGPSASAIRAKKCTHGHMSHNIGGRGIKGHARAGYRALKFVNFVNCWPLQRMSI